MQQSDACEALCYELLLSCSGDIYMDSLQPLNSFVFLGFPMAHCRLLSGVRELCSMIPTGTSKDYYFYEVVHNIPITVAPNV